MSSVGCVGRLARLVARGRPLTRVHQSQILRMLTKYLYVSSSLGGDAHGHIATVLSIDSHILNISLSLLSSHCYIPPLGYLLPYL